MFLAAPPAPGTHPLTPICGTQYINLQVIKFYYCAFTADTLVSSAIAIVITLALGFWVASNVRAGAPGKLQLLMEFLVGYIRDFVNDSIGKKDTFIIPIAATIFVYILVANWLAFFPLNFSPLLEPANADLNQTLAMAIVVILIVEWYSIRALGPGGFLRRFTRPFEMSWAIRLGFLPFNLVEEVQKPVSLALRLFGNIFAGVLMVYLLAQLPIVISWFPIAIWKAFDVFFVGTIQAFIFMLLTLIYFAQAREGLEEESHGAEAVATSANHTS
jgi:F-type H+-transporting ATPase subunit a